MAKRSVLRFPWLYGPFVRTLISRTDAYAGSGGPTLNFIERFELGSDTAKSLLPVSLGCKQAASHNYRLLYGLPVHDGNGAF